MNPLGSSSSPPRLPNLVGLGMDSSNRFSPKSRSYNPLDDSSSVSSMSSINRGLHCEVCKEPEIPCVRPFVKCKTCKRAWHPACHKPNVEDPKIEFQCSNSKCLAKMKQKMNTSSDVSSMPALPPGGSSTSSLPSESLKEANRMKGSRCRKEGCKNPIFQVGSNTKVLCKQHEIEQKSKNAALHKTGDTFRTSAAPRPFNRKKLHPVKPDEEIKALLKSHKRKRSGGFSPEKRSMSYNGAASPANDVASSKVTGLKPQLQGQRSTSYSSNQLNRASQGKSKNDVIPNQPPNKGQPQPNLNVLVPKTDESLANASKGNLFNKLLHPTDIIPVEDQSTSPEYEPPPPLPDHLANPWEIEEDRDDSPGSQIAQEFKATVEQPSENRHPIEIPKATQSLFMTELNSFQPPEIELPEPQTKPRPLETLVIPTLHDVEMQDYQSPYPPVLPESTLVGAEVTVREPGGQRKENQLKRAKELSEQAILRRIYEEAHNGAKLTTQIPTPDTNSPVPQVEEPVIRSLSHKPMTTDTPSTLHNEGYLAPQILVLPVMTSAAEIGPLGLSVFDPPNDEKISIIADPESLEAIRQQNAKEYDSSTLDSILLMRSQPVEESQPTPAELKAQNFGHIDPRLKWPKEHSDEWLAEKREEIEARGGRKANFGKLLTPQVVKERRERGWNIHQNKAVVNDAKSEQGARVLEELFGIKNIDELEPGVRNGQLVMMEKPVDENGKKKRKPRVYTVG